MTDALEVVFRSSPYEACNRMARFLRCLWGVRRWEAVVPGEPRKRVVGHLRESTPASLPQIETMDMTRRSRSARPRVATTKRRHAVLRVEATETGEENASTPGG